MARRQWIAAAGLIALAGCTSPGDFDYFEGWEQCEAPHFDYAASEYYCTGLVDKADASIVSLPDVQALFDVAVLVAERDGVVATVAAEYRAEGDCQSELRFTIMEEGATAYRAESGACDTGVGLPTDLVVLTGSVVAFSGSEEAFFTLNLADGEVVEHNLELEIDVPYEYNYAYAGDLEVVGNELWVAAGDAGICRYPLVEGGVGDEPTCMQHSPGGVAQSLSARDGLLWVADLLTGVLVYDSDLVAMANAGDTLDPLGSASIPNDPAPYDGFEILALPWNDDGVGCMLLSGGELGLDGFSISHFQYDGDLALPVVATAYDTYPAAFFPRLSMLGDEHVVVSRPSLPEELFAVTDEEEPTPREVQALADASQPVALDLIDVSVGSDPERRIINRLELVHGDAADAVASPLRHGIATREHIAVFETDRVHFWPVVFDYLRPDNELQW